VDAEIVAVVVDTVVAVVVVASLRLASRTESFDTDEAVEADKSQLSLLTLPVLLALKILSTADAQLFIVWTFL
jgi:hypothetical protein